LCAPRRATSGHVGALRLAEHIRGLGRDGDPPNVPSPPPITKTA